MEHVYSGGVLPYHAHALGVDTPKTPGRFSEAGAEREEIPKQ